MIGSALFSLWRLLKLSTIFGGLVVAQQDADKVELKRRDRFLPRLGDPPLSFDKRRAFEIQNLDNLTHLPFIQAMSTFEFVLSVEV